MIMVEWSLRINIEGRILIFENSTVIDNNSAWRTKLGGFVWGYIEPFEGKAHDSDVMYLQTQLVGT